mmetsp:Transcript_17043/g.32083  ORF Transcript_17043/g.32083 Transcript_17043/m.32083 type:complete len:327 (+) Transcript_17043:173-1153(+)
MLRRARVLSVRVAQFRTARRISGEPDRPFTLPPNEFKPKQSLGQNFLSDQNYVRKIVKMFSDDSEGGKRVVELGPGAGAITRELFKKYPLMGAVEIDQRAVSFLQQKLPSLDVTHQDVLQTDWAAMAQQRGGPLNLIGNLPYYITSQILFSLADSHRAVQSGVFTTQLEVGQRIVSKPNCKPYGILAVVFQLYCQPRLHFTLPPTVFYPQPKVDSALLSLDFSQQHEDLHSVRGQDLRKVVTRSFGKRRKILRQSLKGLLLEDGLVLPDKWLLRRPQELTPGEFLQLTADLYGRRGDSSSGGSEEVAAEDGERTGQQYCTERIWRK